MVSHFLFFVFLSSSFRKTALSLLRGSAKVDVEPHTLHTQHQQRQLPTNAAKRMAVEDVL